MTEVRALREGLAAGLRLGAVPVPGLLLQAYARLGLTEVEAMLIIHLMYFADREHTQFPTPDQLASRMSTPPDRVLAAIERVVRDGYVAIEEDVDMETGIRGERYDLSPLYDRLAQVWAEMKAEGWTPEDGEPAEAGLAGERMSAAASARAEAAAGKAGVMSQAPGGASGGRGTAASRRKDLFSVFESEFARPLSPIEYETIVGWLDQDQFSDALINAALKEAVFAGKVNFRYIDRILLEWRRNRITTPEEARAYTERFRGER